VYIASFIWIVQYVIVITTNIALRSTAPEHPRPYRVPGGRIPTLSVVGLAAILFFLVLSVVPPWGDTLVLYYGMGMIVVIVVYGAIMGAVTRRSEDPELTRK
jgi:amino acid transporter